VENPCLKRRFPPPWTVDEANNACFDGGVFMWRSLGHPKFEDGPK
jgi:hypothetical protein